VPASSKSVALSVEAAGVLRARFAIILGVCTFRRSLARTGPVADLTEAAFIFRVTVVGVVGADTNVPCHVASLAGVSARGIAAHTVDAVTRNTLVLFATGLAVGLLSHAGRSDAVVAGDTITVVCTRPEAGIARGVALIG